MEAAAGHDATNIPGSLTEQYSVMLWPRVMKMMMKMMMPMMMPMMPKMPVITTMMRMQHRLLSPGTYQSNRMSTRFLKDT